MIANEVVPFLAVSDMRKSVSFYVEGLGFELSQSWEDEGVLRWCRLQAGKAALMLQQFRTEGPDARSFAKNRGEGVVLCFFCDDAVSLWRGLKARGVEASAPEVGNGLWVTRVMDPDGYVIDFESPADEPEGTSLRPTGA